MRRLLPCLAALALFGAADQARAGTVSVDTEAQTVVYQGDAEENNVNVYVSFFRGVYAVQVSDFYGETTTDSPLCSVTPSDDVECELPWAPIEKLLGGGGDDALASSNATFRPAGHLIDGQDGNDELQGGAAAETLVGGPGDDELAPDAPPRARAVAAGPNDVVIGGPGVDEANYEWADGPAYSLTLDGVANDGAPGENDDLREVENLTGSLTRPNTLVGDDLPNELYGGSGADTLIGAGGNDVLEGDAGNDLLDGGAGDDELAGGGEDDRLTGGPGTDTFSGDGSSTAEQAPVGNDQIFARDGVKESIACGPGTDTAQLDADDVLAKEPQGGCEVVDRPPLPGLPTPAIPSEPPRTGSGGPGGGGPGKDAQGSGAAGGGAPGGAVAARPGIRSSILRLRGSRLTISVACPAGGRACAGRVTVRSTRRVKLEGRRRAITIASGSYSVKAGGRSSVRLRVSQAARTVLRRRRTLSVRVVLRASPGADPVAERTVLLRR